MVIPYLLTASLLATAPSALSAGDLHIATPDLPHLFDPHQRENRRFRSFFEQVFESLVRVQSDGTILAQLASTWSVADDGLRWRFHLREDVSFHNNTPLTSAVVLTNIERFHELNPSDLPPVEVLALDDYTFELTTIEPNAYFLHQLANLFLIGPDAETLSFEPNLWFNGTGPYMLSQWELNWSVLERWEDYWSTPPEFDSVTYRSLDRVALSAEEEAAIAEAFLAGEEFAIAEALTPAAAAIIDVHSDRLLNINPCARIRVLAFNFSRQSISSEYSVRRAVSSAVDHDWIRQELTRGFGADSLDECLPYDVALEGHREMNGGLNYFEERGYAPHGRFRIGVVPGDELAAHIIASSLDAFALPIELIDFRHDMDFDAVLFSYPLIDNEGFEFLTSMMLPYDAGHLNLGQYENVEVVELLYLASQEFEDSFRKANLARVFEIVHHDAAFVFLTAEPALAASREVLTAPDRFGRVSAKRVISLAKVDECRNHACNGHPPRCNIYCEDLLR